MRDGYFHYSSFIHILKETASVASTLFFVVDSRSLGK
jgi:hypothetical protein